MFFSDLYLQAMENSFLSKKRMVFGFALRALGLSKLEWTRLHLEEFPKATSASPKRSNNVNLVDNSGRVDIDAAVRETCDDRLAWEISSKSMGFGLIFFAGHASLVRKTLCTEEQKLFDGLNNNQNKILQRLDDKQVCLRYGDALTKFLWTGFS